MSLAKRLMETEPARRGLPCAVDVLLCALPKQDAQALVAAMAVPKGDPRRLSSRVISETLHLEGYKVGPRSISNHRNGACRCGFGRTSNT